MSGPRRWPSPVPPSLPRPPCAALFFLSIAVGTAGAGSLAGFYDTSNETPYFLVLGGESIVIGLCLAALNRWITKKMAGVR